MLSMSATTTIAMAMNRPARNATAIYSTREGPLGGRGGVCTVDDVDGLDLHDVLRDAGNVLSQGVGELSNLLGIVARNRNAQHTRGGLARDGNIKAGKAL